MIPEIVPVLDLAGGRAVHARGGERAQYAPVRSVLAAPPGDALALVEAYRSRVSATTLYVADLDAIAGGAPQIALLREISQTFGGTLLIDAGISSVAAAEPIRALRATVIVGLETLDSFSALKAIADGGAVCFSLDLRDGKLVCRDSLGVTLGHASPVTVAQAAVDAGASEILVLDVARVGRPIGPDCLVLAELRAVFPGLRLLAGGGVRGREDLAALGAAGCDAALVATALHEGRLHGVHAR